MLTHVVIFNWIAGTTAEQVAGVTKALDLLAAEMGATISHGPDIAIRSGNGDYGLIASFADEAGWQDYQADPRHKAFVRDVVTPLQASRLTIQFRG